MIIGIGIGIGHLWVAVVAVAVAVTAVVAAVVSYGRLHFGANTSGHNR